MKKFKAVIIDDEKLARNLLKIYLKENMQIEIIKECENGFEGVKAVNELKPDFIFLDIQMPKISGFEMLELLDEKPEIIFTTAYDKYAIKAFEHNAIDYLLKPFSKERLQKAIESVLLRLENSEKKISANNLINSYLNNAEKLTRIVVKKRAEIHILPIDTIHFFEAQDDYVLIHAEKGNFLQQKTMKFYENHLNDKQFVRIHRSYILNVKQIVKLELYDKESFLVVLKCGDKIKASKPGYKKLKEILDF
ncbi:MAG: response regulator [Chlorobi bacterium]|nr:response regulator [Chlorobiota bacterium]